jgi:citrate lyase subunit beta/citryl-CoA lyase
MIPTPARSWLFTPGDRPNRFATARDCGADAMILDWEDAVAPAAKAEARTAVLDWLNTGIPGGPAVWVRINNRRSDFWHDDLTALAAAPAHRLAGVLLPKTQSGRDVADTAVRVRGGIAVVALIETALGVESATEIARAAAVLALALGSADLRLDAGLGDDDTGWIYPRSRLVFASRAAGLRAPIDGPEMRLDDVDAVRRSAPRARAFGFGAKLCLHPRQIAAVNEAFGYDDRQRSWAQRVVAAADTSAGAAVRVDGEMVDRPRLELARRILAGTATLSTASPPQHSTDHLL